MTDGTSAQYTNRSVAEATLRAADQPPVVRSENFSVDVGPDRSTQLRMTPRSDADSCGCPLSGDAGVARRTTDGEAGPGMCAASRATSVRRPATIAAMPRIMATILTPQYLPQARARARASSTSRSELMD